MNIKKTLIFFSAYIISVVLITGCASQQIRSSEANATIPHYTFIADETIAEPDYEAAKTILDRRLSEMGYEDYSINADSSGISLDIKEENADILSGLCQKGELFFREGTEQDGEIILSGSELDSAYAHYDAEYNRYDIGLTFTDDGAQRFTTATEKLVGKHISIWLDGECIMSPAVQTAITGKNVVITSPDFNADTVRIRIAQLNSGILPFELKLM